MAKEWLSTPTTTGNVVVSGLSVGEHYFVCSVGTHCQHGMRFTVTVQPNNNNTKINPSTQVFMPSVNPIFIYSLIHNDFHTFILYRLLQTTQYPGIFKAMNHLLL